jgi:diguanylate cyclase (GGDEF)-like protein/PAS domain S-box-containing protein
MGLCSAAARRALVALSQAPGCLDDTDCMDRSWSRTFLVASLVATAGFFAFPAGGRAQAVVQVAVNVGAFAAIVLGVLAHRPEGRAGWWVLAAGEALYAVAGVVFFAYPAFTGAVLPFPSVADGLYLGSYAMLASGVALLVSRRGGRDWSGLFDAAIVTVGAGLLSFVFLIGPNAVSSRLSELGRIVAVAYPLVDLLLLAVAVRLAIGGLGTPAQRLLGLWLASQLVADTWYAATVLQGSFRPGHPVSAGWLVSFGFLGAAALHPSMSTLAATASARNQGGRRGRLAMLALASMLAPGLLAVYALGDGDSNAMAIAVASALIVALVLARVGRLMVDVRLLEAAETRLQASQAELQQAQQLAQLGSWTWDLTSGEVTWSDELFRILGLPPEQQGASVETLQRLLHPDDRQRILELIERSLGTGTPFEAECRILLRDGAVRMLHARGEVDTDSTGRPARMVGTAQDVTERNRAQQGMHRLAAIVQASSDAIYSVGSDWTVTSWNPAAEALFGRPAAEIIGRPITSLWPPEQLATDTPMFERAFNGEVIADFETVRLRGDGNPVAVALSWSPIRDDAGQVTGVSVIARDITQRKQLEEQLVRQALHDPLTGLANRALFGDRLENALARAVRPATMVAVLVVDLDGFKDVNDSLGHDAGDDLLTIVAARLQGHTRAGDTVARLGGDEFVVLLEDTDAAGAIRVAELLLEALVRPVMLRDRTITPTASIGIALAAGEDGDALLRNADLAMYAAKRQGKSRYRLFEPAMLAGVVDRLELAADLSRAVQEGQLHLNYQPEIDLRSGRIVGLEALLRWRHPTRGLVLPTEFIPLAEETGLILPIGRWVLETACQQAKAWQQRHLATAPFTIAVNLSAYQLQHPAIVDEVGAALMTADLDPQSLVLEITETAVMADLDAAVTILTQLRQLGVRMALDDFGTGYSSLSYLQRLPVDILKIDRSFVSVAGSAEESALARTIVKLGQTLGLETVAEGIETAEQLATLRELGCQLGQGYYFAKPLDPDAVDELLEREHHAVHGPTPAAHPGAS